MSAAIEVEGLVKDYRGLRAVDGLSLRVEEGEVYALLGPNGAGKTTTVEILEGLRRPDGGTVTVLGLDPLGDGPALRRRMGVMLQEGGTYPGATPAEMLRLFAAFYPDPRPVGELLELTGLTSRAAVPTRRLSGGEKQRLSLALCLVGRPRLAFLDEPTAGMDPVGRLRAWEAVEDLRDDGVTVLLTTHSMEEAERLADRVGIIDRGSMRMEGSPAALRRETAGIRFTARPGLAVDQLSAVVGCSVLETGPGAYLIEVEAPNAEVVASLTAWLAERRVLLGSLTVGAAGLEEVFLRAVEGTEVREPTTRAERA